jgi:asparagine synthase (glutamine-hydrolysing)
MTCELGPLNVSISCFSGCELLSAPDLGITIAYYGQIVGSPSPELLAETYRKRGQEFAADLNGSFALLILDSQNACVIAVTDRVASRNIYYSCERNDSIALSTSMYQLCSMHATGLPLDPAGVAWYLSNGVVHGNRTLFSGIHRMERACCYIINEHGRNLHEYWTFAFTPSLPAKVTERTRQIFGDILIEAVARRAPQTVPLCISLSGGYDSSGILAILSNKLHRKDLRSFSYGLNEKKVDSDAYVAKRIASECGCEHTFLRSYDGNLFDSIEANALLGDGLSNFCDESSVWIQLSRNHGGYKLPLFAGENWFGMLNTVDLCSDDDVLNRVHIRDLAGLEWLMTDLSRRSIRALSEGIQGDIASLLLRCPITKDFYEKRDFLFLDQNLSHVLLPWRENFAGRAFFVQEPWLDNDVLDFMTTVPSVLRNGRTLYHNTIKEMVPELFRVKRARIGLSVPDWGNELSRFKGSVTSRYIKNGRDSALDDLIPPETVLKVIEGQLHPSRRQESLPQRAAWKLMRLTGLRNMIKRNELSSADFLLRYLVLRRSLDVINELRQQYRQ